MILVAIANIRCLVLWVHDGQCGWKSKHVLGCCLNTADCLMAVYLAMLVTEDSIYHNDVGFVALHWKTSTICLSSGVICLLSVEMSTMITLLIAVDRVICIVITPFRRKGFTLKTAVITAMTVWVVTLVTFSVAFQVTPPHITNSACIIVGSSLSLKFSILLLTYNSLLFTILCILYAILAQTVVKTSLNKDTRKVRKMILKLGGILLTNFLAWMIISILSILSIAGSSLYPSLETLLGILLFPLNALVNPLIYKPDPQKEPSDSGLVFKLYSQMKGLCITCTDNNEIH